MIGLLLYVVVVVLLGWLAVWILGKLAPGHPAILDNLIWVLVVVIAVLVVLRALGIADIPVPRLR